MNKDYSQDLSEIRNLMNRSSRFLSLSGTSGIMAGIYAILGAGVSKIFFLSNVLEDQNVANPEVLLPIVIILMLVLMFSIITAYFLSVKEAKKNDEQIWDETAKRLVFHFLVPLLTGGAYILLKLNQGQIEAAPSLMLIFYGLALLNASKYTIGTIKYLGISEIIIGLICACFPGFGFWFWTIGFGLLHIIYGSLMNFQKK
ncbi:hypothetical protein [Zunongwangia sp. HRR-M8]|uniref:hypothetical protein n=1 Tax=Zunongwangia sp. HRR-M8 TaxID=3015170 RepID=UPI0022DDC93C|nr:hypothetical protein [Zunongwangia sp. HRR-M8]WBL21629.1 hypothetical protein PBT89_12905 [Zunongwangia sp. HRR-M8]